jgi:hypothetical protein
MRQIYGNGSVQENLNRGLSFFIVVARYDILSGKNVQVLKKGYG